jgi:hypothetical protein
MRTIAIYRKSSAAGPTSASSPSFDPSLPQDGSLILAGVLRDQFNSLKGLIDDRATHEEVLTSRNDAIAAAEGNSAKACPQVIPLSMSASWRHDPNQIQEMIDKLNQLINALQR